MKKINYDSSLKEINARCKELGIEVKKISHNKWRIGEINVLRITVHHSYARFGYQRTGTHKPVLNYAAGRSFEELDKKYYLFADTLKDIKVDVIGRREKLLKTIAY